MEARFKKTKGGEWAVYGPVTEVTVGACTVATKGGKTKVVQVTSLGKPHKPTWAKGATYVYGYLAPKATEAASDALMAPEPKATTKEEALAAVTAAVKAALAAGASQPEALTALTAAFLA